MADDSVVIQFRGEDTNLTSTTNKVAKAMNDFQTVVQNVQKSLGGSGGVTQSAATASRSLSAMQEVLRGIQQGVGQDLFRGLRNSLIGIPKDILATTIAFEKYRTSISTLTGSTSSAAREFNRLAELSAALPFEIGEATESFIKLQGRGITPTNELLTKLSDLTSSQGKGLLQITEAVLDAQVGQTRRLEEIGIAVDQRGEKTKLMFRGVTKEVEKNGEALLDAILSFAELPGVLGSSEAQAKTLGGRLSTLKDVATLVSDSFGKELLPVLKQFVEDILGGEAGIKQFAQQLGENTASGLQLLGNALKFVGDNAKLFEIALQAVIARMVILQAIQLTSILTTWGTSFAAIAVSLGGFQATLSLITATVLPAFIASLTAALPLILAVGGAVATVQLFQFSSQLREANEALEAFATQIDVSAGASLNLQKATKALNDEFARTGKFTQEQSARAKQLSELNNEQIASLKEIIKNIQSQSVATEEQRNTQQVQVATAKAMIQSLENQNDQLLKNISAQDKNNKASKEAVAGSKDRKAAIDAEVESLERRRQAAATAAGEEFQDTQTAATERFADEQRALQEEFNDRRREAEQQFQSGARRAEQDFQEQEREKEESFREDLNNRQQQFNETQRAEERAFRENLNAAQREFNASLQAEEGAFSAQQKAERELFQEQEKALQKIQSQQEKLQEAQASGDAEQIKRIQEEIEREKQRDIAATAAAAREREFEAQQQAEKEQFEAQIQLKKDEFEKAQRVQIEEFEAQQQEKRKAFEATLRAEESKFAEDKQQRELAFQESQRIAQQEFEESQRAAQREFESSQRELEREFQTEQRELERTFREQERQKDLEIQRQIAALRNSTPQGRKTGGPVEAGTPYFVGEGGGYRELFVPGVQGTILPHTQTERLVREALSRSIPDISFHPQGSIRPLLMEIQGLRKDLRKMGVPVTANFHQNFPPVNQEDVARLAAKRTIDQLNSALKRI